MMWQTNRELEGKMKNIRVTALFEEGNQNKNKCSIKNAALVGYHQKLCGGSYLCGIRNC